MKNIEFKIEVLYHFGGHVGCHLEFQYEDHVLGLAPRPKFGYCIIFNVRLSNLFSGGVERKKYPMGFCTKKYSGDSLFLYMIFNGISKLYESTSELRVRLALRVTGLSPPVKYFYWSFQGGASFVEIYVISVLILLCFRTRLFIDALWSPAGKGLTSWLSFVKSNCEVVTFPFVRLV